MQRVDRSPMIQSYTFNGPLVAIDSDKDFRFFAVGGREAIRILQINTSPTTPPPSRFSRQKPGSQLSSNNSLNSNPNFDLRRRLSSDAGLDSEVHASTETNFGYEYAFTLRGSIRSKGNNNSQMAKPATNDLSWNKVRNSLIAYGSTTGIVSIYDINLSAKESQLKITNTYNKKEHEAQVQKIQWDPNSPNLLMSVSENEIKMWDIRADGVQIKNIGLEADKKIKDAKYNPKISNLIAVGYDSGGLEVFDIRKIKEDNANPNSCWKVQHAHAHIVSIDWNPYFKDTLASASLDKEIKIWDTAGESNGKSRECIYHVSSVNTIKWRRNDYNLIGASSLNSDNQIYFYDIRHSFRPHSIFKGHTDVVKSFLFNEDKGYLVSGSLLAGSRDSSVIVQSLNNYVNPYDTCPRAPLSIDPLNDVFFHTEQPEDLSLSPQTLNPREIIQLKKAANSSRLNLKQQIIYLHENYLRGLNHSLDEIGSHNSHIASELGKESCEHFWKLIFVVSFPDYNQNHSIDSLYEDHINTGITFYDDKLYLNDKNKARREILRLDIQQVLQHIIDEGEIQTAVIAMLSLVARDRNILDPLFVENVMAPYIEILRKFQLYTIASRTILDSKIQSMTSNTNQGTTMKIGCGFCKESLKGSSTCEKCKTVTMCVLCQEPLGGLVVWCQYCGHGGHIKEYKQWFGKESECPYGCGHRCFQFS